MVCFRTLTKNVLLPTFPLFNSEPEKKVLVSAR